MRRLDPFRAESTAPTAGDRRSLVLWPASDRGWFGGHGIIVWDPIDVQPGQSLSTAAAALETTFTAEQPGLTAALIAYDGSATIARYAGGLRWDDGGWRCFGAPPADADEVLSALRSACEPGTQAAPIPDPAAGLLANPTWDLAGRDFRAAVDDVRESIASGDVYVLNLTARLTGVPVLSPAESFSALVDRAGADMNAYLAGWPGSTPWLASVSPERFLRVRTGEHGSRIAEVQPIKGTRPRGASTEADQRLARELAADPKERAEHVMVVDLERNDLGIVCAPGTVHVDPLYEVIATPYCHQLVSTVRGTLRSTASFAELLTATFPCGSVTGAPKRAAIRIASQLERSPRGAYCGSLVVAMPGELDSSVLIRTLEGIAETPEARWGAGCGVTHDSDPPAEQLEALLKASPVLGDGAPPVALRETMRVAHGRVPLLDRHLARLVSGGAGPSVLSRVREAVDTRLASVDPSTPYARVSITVTPDGSVAAGVSEEPSSLEVPGGPRIIPIAVAEPPALPPAAAKPAARRYWDRAHNAARLAGGDQAALHLADGTIIDGSTATIWLVIDGELVTPPAPPAVSGVCRELVFDIARQAGIHAREATVTLDDLRKAQEVFLSNGVGLVVPAAGRGGPVTGVIASSIGR